MDDDSGEEFAAYWRATIALALIAVVCVAGVLVVTYAAVRMGWKLGGESGEGSGG